MWGELVLYLKVVLRKSIKSAALILSIVLTPVPNLILSLTYRYEFIKCAAH